MANAKAIAQEVMRTLVARLQGQDSGDPLGIGNRIRDAFFVTIQSGVIAPAASDIQRFTLDVDADFLITSAVEDVRDNAIPATRVADPNILVSIAQSQSGRTLQNIALPITNLCGKAGVNVPEWPAPKYLSGGTTVTITQTSLLPGGGISYISRITFWGFKVFR